MSGVEESLSQNEIDNLLNPDDGPSFQDIAEALGPKKEKKKEWNGEILSQDERDALLSELSGYSNLNHSEDTYRKAKKIEIVDWRRPPFLSIENKKVLNELIYRALLYLKSRTSFSVFEDIIKTDDYTELIFREFVMSLDKKDYSYTFFEQSKIFKKNKVHFLLTVDKTIPIDVSDEITKIFNEIFFGNLHHITKTTNDFKIDNEDRSYGMCFCYVVTLADETDERGYEQRLLNIYVSKEMIKKIKKLTWDVLDER